MKRSIIPRVLRKVGLEVFRRSTLPRGVKLEVDLKRVLRAEEKLTFLDVGANVGQTALYLNSHFPDASIHSFEPVREVYNELQSRTKKKQIHCYQMAMGEEVGSLQMAILESSVWNRVVEENDLSVAVAGKHTVEVPANRVDRFCEKKGISNISLLKTDCEGYDAHVLKGAVSLFQEKKVNAVLSEVNFREDGKHGDFFEISSFLKQYGFRFFGLYAYSHWKSVFKDRSFCNALYVLKEEVNV